jgi:hypothetical protein
MRTALMLLALLAAPALAGPTVWKWVDEKGVTHYSDQPIPGAERVEISGVSRADSVQSSPATRSQPPAPAVTSYRNFEILKPANGDTLPNTAGVVEVRVRFEPGLQPGHSLALYLDGVRVQDFPSGAQEHTLREVPRGSHTLVAAIHDQRGTRLQETSASFTVRQESIAQPPVGPSLRPAPKPRN